MYRPAGLLLCLYVAICVCGQRYRKCVGNWVVGEILGKKQRGWREYVRLCMCVMFPVSGDQGECKEGWVDKVV